MKKFQTRVGARHHRHSTIYVRRERESEELESFLLSLQAHDHSQDTTTHPQVIGMLQYNFQEGNPDMNECITYMDRYIRRNRFGRINHELISSICHSRIPIAPPQMRTAMC